MIRAFVASQNLVSRPLEPDPVYAALVAYLLLGAVFQWLVVDPTVHEEEVEVEVLLARVFVAVLWPLVLVLNLGLALRRWWWRR